METHTIHFEGISAAQAQCFSGSQDRNLSALSELFGVEMVFRDDTVSFRCSDEKAEQITLALNSLYQVASKERAVTTSEVIYAYRMAVQGKEAHFDELTSVVVGRTLSGRPVVPKTAGQLELVKAMQKYPIVFAIGPAGTGKTYLAVIQAVSMLKKGDIKRIVLTRPAVEAGENLGFLPGDLKEKVDPYLTPLYDALHDMLGNEQTDRLIEKGSIEIAPLAYMRGRTLDDSFVILDEAQNTTPSQMKMFLTRLGMHSHMVINGDITQIDLKYGTVSGLVEASGILKNISEIAMVRLSGDDVVRHPLVQKIIEEYEKAGR